MDKYYIQSWFGFIFGVILMIAKLMLVAGIFWLIWLILS